MLNFLRRGRLAGRRHLRLDQLYFPRFRCFPIAGRRVIPARRNRVLQFVKLVTKTTFSVNVLIIFRVDRAVNALVGRFRVRLGQPIILAGRRDRRIWVD